MNQVPSINQFLDEIDPDKTIDRKQASVDMGKVALLSIISKANDQLSKEGQEKFSTILQDKDVNLNKIQSFFQKLGKAKDFSMSLEKGMEEVKNDYIKTHLKALPSETKEKVLSKFPGLKSL